MRILKQPSGMDFTQPLLNRILRVHVVLMHGYESVSGRSSSERSFYDAKTREWLPYSNWRTKIIRKLGT